MANKEKVIIFDTTLRDGEQSAGAGLTVDEKTIIALQLEKLAPVGKYGRPSLEQPASLPHHISELVPLTQFISKSMA